MGVKVRERPKGSGIYWIMIDHHGKRKAKKIGTDKKTALISAGKIAAKLTLGEFDIETKEEYKAPPTYKEVATVWLETRVKTLNRPSTYERYSGALNKHILPAVGDIPMDQVTRSDIRNLLIKHYSKGHPKSSVCTLKDICNGPFVHALDEGLITVNPVVGVAKRLNMKREKSKIEPLNHGEVQAFLEACDKHYPEYFPFFLLLFRTGLRLGEALPLEWGDVDFHGRFIVISKSFRRHKVENTKTNKTRRVDMSNQLVEVLQKLYTRRKREALEMGRGIQVIEIVFHREGKMIEQDHIRKIYNRILKKAGLHHIRVHNTRHTFSSLLLTDGVTPVYVKEQLGHSSIQMTVDIYGHLIPNSNREAVNRLDFPQPSATQAQPAQNEKRASY
jgi:integrase